MNSVELFDDYLHGKLNTAERRIFEERLQKDPQFAEAFQLYKEVDMAILQDDIEDFRSKLEQIHEANRDELNGQTSMQVAPSLEDELDKAIIEQEVMALREKLDRIHAHMEEEVDVTGVLPGYSGIDKAIADQNSLELKEELNQFADQESTDRAFTPDELLEHEVDQAIRESDVMELRQKINQIGKKIQPQRSIVQMRSRRIQVVSAAAAILVLAIVSSVFLSGVATSVSPEKAVTRFYEPYPADANTRGVSIDKVDAFENGMKRYRAGDWETAFDFFFLKEGNNPDNTFFLGMSALMLDRIETAQQQFNEYLLTGENSYLEASEYYLTACYLRRNEYKKAQTELEKIASDPMHHYSEQANAILKKTRF